MLMLIISLVSVRLFCRFYQCRSINIKMGCNASCAIVNSSERANLEHQMVHLIVTNQTNKLIEFIHEFKYEIDINAAINFRGDTLLHYACAKNNLQLVKYLIGRPDILKTCSNYLKKIPKELANS